VFENRPAKPDSREVRQIKAMKAMQGINEGLLDARPQARADALLAYGLLTQAEIGMGRGRVATVIKHLTDKDCLVQSAASRALTSVLSNGCVKEIEATLQALKHEDPRVRCSVLKCLRTPHCTRLPVEGNTEVLKSIALLLTDIDVDVRTAAMSAFGSLGSKGESWVVETTLSYLSDPSPRVRAAALRALGRLAEKGDVAATTAISEHADDEDVEVKIAALQSLGVVAKKADETARDIVLDHLEDGSSQVRDAAIRALSRVAAPGDTKVQRAIQERLDDEAPHVRFSAKYLMVYLTPQT